MKKKKKKKKNKNKKKNKKKKKKNKLVCTLSLEPVTDSSQTSSILKLG